MLKRVRQFAALDLRDQWVFIQAWFLLGWVRAAILSTSFKRLSSHLEHHRAQPEPVLLEPAQLQKAASIGKLVAMAANHTPWQSLCLAQVLVTQRLLARRHIPGQFYLGVRRGEEMENEDLAAHAWLQCADKIVNGGAGHEQYAIVSTFSWGKGNG